MMDRVNSSTPTLTTRFAGLSSGRARAVLGLTAAAILVCLAVTCTAEVAVRNHETGDMTVQKVILDGTAFQLSFSDFRFYTKVVEGVRGGEWYYDVLPRLFPEFNYQPFSIFNFRTPVYAWVLGLPPTLWIGRGLLAGLGTVVLAMAVVALRRAYGTGMALLGALALTGGVGWCFAPPVYLFAEQWAGTLIALSIFCYAFERWQLGVAAGLAALFFRELSLAYCVVALFLAWREGQMREVVAWLMGLAAYAAFLVFHVSQVSPRLPPGAGASAGSWIQFGGLTFLLETGMANFYQVLLLPWWCVALTLPLGILGLIAWPGELAARVCSTVAVYLAAFAIVGQWFNAYWGLMYIPLLSLGLAWALPALRDLFKSAFAPATPPPAQEGA